MTVNFKDTETRMDKAIDSLKHEFASLRTGRASATMLDSVQVEAYGSAMPLNQVAGVSAPEARMLLVTVWDQNLVKEVEKAIIDSKLGLNPQTEGNVLRLPIPELNEERRLELAKVAGKYAEQAKVAVRNIRRDAMDEVKGEEKQVGKDEAHKLSDQVQKLTDSKIAAIDSLLADKEKEITAI